MGEKCRSRSYPVSSFHILILPTEFLRASSARHRTLTDPSHTRERSEVSEPLRNERWRYSDLYSIREIAKFVSTMYRHAPMPLFCYGTLYIYKKRIKIF